MELPEEPRHAQSVGAQGGASPQARSGGPKKHLIISRELPPAPYAPGGIGTYVHNIAHLLAAAGETVHVIAQRWKGAPLRRETLLGGRLVIHRIAKEDPPARTLSAAAEARWQAELRALRPAPEPGAWSALHEHWFALQAALMAERLVDEEGIDVVEGQEWEAPLYYLLLRRELGLGPRRRVPCFVHLHSPSEFITRFDGQHGARPDLLALQRMERYCITHADALLCPSEFLARQCEREFGLAAHSVAVIRLPIGELRPLPRDADIWAQGSICYMGRLEPRKGVIEWIDAAVQVAATVPGLHFDFVGSDMPTGDTSLSMQRFLMQRIPRALRSRFRFHGSQPRAALPGYLARACAAVVPSRWENFPNTCIEAMGSGLPVIATRFGGMAEMVEDGVSGWLADAPDQASMVPALAAALRRCVQTPPARRRAMGAAAARAVGALCDNRRTTAQHIAFRARLAPPQDTRAARAAPLRVAVVAWLRGAEAGAATLAALQAQSAPPAALIVLGPPERDLQTAVAAAGGRWAAAQGHSAAHAWNQGYALATQTEHRGAFDAWLFLDEHDALEPDALARLGEALAAAPALGAVGCWTALPGGRAHTPQHPELPHQWFAPDASRAMLFRSAALPQGGLPLGAGAQPGLELWELSVDVLARGWPALTYPALLAQRTRDDLTLPWEAVVAFRERRAVLMQRYPAVLTRDAAIIADLYVATRASAPAVQALTQQKGARRGRRVRRARRLLARLMHRLMRVIKRPTSTPLHEGPAQ